MRKNRFVVLMVYLFLIPLLVLQLPLTASAAGIHQDQRAATRKGAWVDSLSFSIVDEGDALTAIKNNNIDMYVTGLENGYKDALAEPDIEVELSNNIYNELTLNPAEFNDTSRLNPFSVPAIREALNYLIDRDHIVHSIFDDMATGKFVPIIKGFPDYQRYASKIAALESKYAYNPSTAQTQIAVEMAKLGATLSGGKWTYKGNPVTLIFLIRTEDLRLQIGNYIADQLESIGFTVDRQYKTSAQASPLWLQSDPADGLWHLYTGGWICTAIDRDQATMFGDFYTPNGWPGIPLWEAYNPTPEFQDLADLLFYQTYSTWTERNTAFERALELALEDSARVWLVDEKYYTARRLGTTATFDLAAGLSQLYPYTLRYLGTEGGDMDVGISDMFVDPWNPVAGSNWVYDRQPQWATEDHALLPNPTDGLPMTQRIESAAVTVQNGLPVQDSSDWLTLDFASTIDVPADAWSEWDAENEVFITAADQYPGGITAKVKSVVTYPSDLFTSVQWHDGSALSIGDFVMGMILPEDRSDENSLLHDESAYGYFGTDGIKGIRITSEDPLMIETYTDNWQLDAESMVYGWWPEGDYGPLPWHTTALAAWVEAAEDAAFSSSKAEALVVPWMNYLHGDTLTLMNTTLTPLNNEVPYSATLSAYIDSTEATSRWSNLKTWYGSMGHFWLGTGPFYIDNYSWSNQTLELTRFADFPDDAGKWDEFSADPNPILEINYGTGAPGSFFTLTGSLYPPNSTARVYVGDDFVAEIAVDSSGDFVVVLDTTYLFEGTYDVLIKINPAAIVQFELTEAAPKRKNEDPDKPLLTVPVNSFYLPLILSD